MNRASANTRPTVLMVDDVEANLIALEAQLSRLDCRLVRARNGNDALRELLKQDVAVMLLDVQMPEMDGYEVARYARENSVTCDVPIIFVTAQHETEDTKLLGYGAGAVDVLFKPINPHILRSKVQVFLELHDGRRRLADEIRAHKRTLGELEAFNYSVSHDLRAPVRAVEGFSRVLLEDYLDKLEGDGKDYLQRIVAAARRMDELIDDLLKLSRASKAEMSIASVDLGAMCSTIIEDLRQADPARQVEFVATSEARADGDARLLKIALENLLRNAWKFTKKRPDAKIEFGLKRENGGVTFSLRDNGAGFEMKEASRLGQPFQRAHSISEFEGSGIGLAIVNRIIDRHGGRLWFTGAPEQGATFYFTLP